MSGSFHGQRDRDCWCQYWRQSSSAYHSNAPGSGKEKPPPAGPRWAPAGMLAYVHDRPVGWLGFWPAKTWNAWLAPGRSKKIDDEPVWSIVCFKIQADIDGKGVAKALLRGAIEKARESAHRRSRPIPSIRRVNASTFRSGTSASLRCSSRRLPTHRRDFAHSDGRSASSCASPSNWGQPLVSLFLSEIGKRGV